MNALKSPSQSSLSRPSTWFSRLWKFLKCQISLKCKQVCVHVFKSLYISPICNCEANSKWCIGFKTWSEKKITHTVKKNIIIITNISVNLKTQSNEGKNSKLKKQQNKNKWNVEITCNKKAHSFILIWYIVPYLYIFILLCVCVCTCVYIYRYIYI